MSRTLVTGCAICLVALAGCTSKPASIKSVSSASSPLTEPALGAAIGVRAPLSDSGINTQQAFREQLVGQPIAYGNDSMLLNENGTLTGRVGGEDIAGVWSWDNGLVCHTGKVGSGQYDGDCGILANAEFSAVSVEESASDDGQAPLIVYETALPAVAEPEYVPVEFTESEITPRTRQSIINESTSGVLVSF